MDIPFALYDAFTDRPFGGSQACVVTNAEDIGAELRFRIAKELGMPATSFVDGFSADSIEAQFYSTIMELPMCGHGTMCLMTRMVELGAFGPDATTPLGITLKLPKAETCVELTRDQSGRTVTMLDIAAPSFSRSELDLVELATCLGVDDKVYGTATPVEIASGDFVHLVVPIADLASMRRIAPDFSRLKRFCNDHGLETVAAFCRDVERPGSTIHVRDFCPAVGVAESAAAGTTNAALTSYLIRHGLVQANGDGRICVQAEQGLEIGRPSTINSRATMDGEAIARLQVGGVATKIMDGRLCLPDQAQPGVNLHED